MLRKVQKDLKKEKHYIRLIILDVCIKKQPYFLIQTAQYAHFCPENVLFQSFKRKIPQFFDRDQLKTVIPAIGKHFLMFLLSDGRDGIYLLLRRELKANFLFGKLVEAEFDKLADLRLVVRI